jgi:hypothetical protein
MLSPGNWAAFVECEGSIPADQECADQRSHLLTTLLSSKTAVRGSHQLTHKTRFRQRQLADPFDSDQSLRFGLAVGAMGGELSSDGL